MVEEKESSKEVKRWVKKLSRQNADTRDSPDGKNARASAFTQPDEHAQYWLNQYQDFSQSKNAGQVA
jgi:hypothetical protein